MMEQRSLDFSPRARTRDPLASHAAADALERSGRAAKQSAQVLALVRATPGLSSAELAARHGLDRHMVARRLPEAARVGLITRREIGAQEVTWWLA